MNNDLVDYINNCLGVPEVIDEKEYVIGIDLGTTNSCVSIWRNNNLEIIPDEYGNNTVPSFVGYTKVNKYVGLDAKNQKELNPKNVFYEFKRLMGKKIDDISVINDKEFFNFDMVSDEQNNVNLITDFGQIITPEELSASILIKLKNMAEKYLKTSVSKAVITVPAYFNDGQRQATKDAAKIAGLDCIRIINEPTAASLIYGLLNKSVSKKYEDESINVIVYDFGGGTLDISLLTITDGLFEVKASVGNTHLGGIDFDSRIISYCINYFKRLYKIDKLSNLSSLSYQKLKRACENAKKILSVSVKTVIAVNNFYEGKDLIINFTRDKMTEICRDLLILALKPLDDILVTAEMNKKDIHEIILVGGMTRMPQIVANIQNFFNGKELNCSMNPDEVVSAGAAIQGYILSNEDDPFSNNVTLLDIIPLSLGIDTIGGVMNTVIKRNTIIPITKKRIYTTDSDYEKSVLIKIYEGERQLTKDNFLVGEFELDGIEPAPRGIARIEVSFNIDINGIITVTAEDITEKDKQTNKKSIIITGNKGRLKQEQINKLINDAKELELRDRIQKKKKELYYEINEITTNIKTNLKNNDFKLKASDKELLSKDIEFYYNWLIEKKYDERSEDEYKDIVESLGKKFGTLILKTTNSKNVDGMGDKIKATTIYGNDKDDEELNKEEYDTKLNDDDFGISDMTDEEKNELKTLKNNLIELAHSIYDLLNDNSKINIPKDENEKLIDIIDDTLLWSYTATKPKKIDFINKINDINNECNKLFDKCKDNINSKLNKIEELENICYSLKSYIMCGLYSIACEEINTIDKKVDFYLEEITNYKIEEYKLNNNDEKTTLKNIFYEKCTQYIDELNILYCNLENELIITDTVDTNVNNNSINNEDVNNGTDISLLLHK